MSADDSVEAFHASAANASGAEDALVDLFRRKFEMPVETFMEHMREQRGSVESASKSASSF
jgi:hypothetical protein